MRFAAIDLGTVTCRLLVADVEGGRIKPLAKEYEIVNLGEGVDATGVLKPEALKRTSLALNKFIRIRDSFSTQESPVLSTRCIATSASRDAKNSSELESIFEKLNLQVEVISGDEEARLTFLGVSSAFTGQEIMVVDVGGGSTELVAGAAGKPPAVKHSYDIGSRRITERYLKSDPPTLAELQNARAYIREVLENDSQAKKFASEAEHSEAKLVAVAGTATSVVSMREKMQIYDSSRVHGMSVTEQELDEIAQNLASLSLSERQKVVGLDPKRAPVIVAGLIILQEVMRAVCAKEFTVSESDILSGIIISLYEKAQKTQG